MDQQLAKNAEVDMINERGTTGFQIWISKLTIACMLLGVLVLPAWGQSQKAEDNNQTVATVQPYSKIDMDSDEDSVLEYRIFLQLKETTVLEGLQKIAQKAGLKLTYDTQLAVLNEKVSVDLPSVSVQNALWTVLEGTGLRFAVSSKGQLILMRRTEKASLELVQETVSGTVTDAQSGEVLPGVNILVKGTTTGTSTGADGGFELTVESLQDTLVVSYIGYQTKEVPISGRSDIEVQLEPQAVMGEEMVVVGYGKQEAINVTGAVDQVSSEELDNRPMANVTQGLQGAMPNVNIDMIEGKPIHSPSINIRGQTSIGQGGSALVLIDGVEGDPSMLNPRDIESISVLKDASAAAVYGARGAFGVVLIETKNAEEEQISITYSSNLGIKEPTVDQNQYVTNGLQWANMFAESFINWEGTFPSAANKTLPFSRDYLNEVERRFNDPSLDRTWVDEDGNYQYAHSTDWFRHLFKKRAFTMNHNLSISGGTDKIDYLISGRIQNQNGLIRLNPDDFQMYNLRAKGAIDFTDWLQVSNNFSISNREYFNPQNCCDAQYAQLDIALEGFPLAPLHNPDGTLSESGAYALGGYAQGHNGINLQKNKINNQIEAEAKLFEDRLSIVSNFTIKQGFNERNQKRVPVSFSSGPNSTGSIGSANNWIRIDRDRDRYITTNTYIEYGNSFLGKHDLTTLAGFNYEQSTFDGLAARRGGLIVPSADDINLALGEDIDTEGGFENWAIMGGFYRLNYIFDERYLVELTGRYDGSSKFPENEQYAFFPSGSVGWRISSEPFWNVPTNIINYFQIRASYGSMGNGNINAYTFNETFNIARSGRILGGNRPRYTSNPGVLPDGLTWETVTTANLGLDLELISGKLGIKADGYIRETTDMFTIALTPPAVFGATAPKGNYADLKTKGWEVEVEWNDGFQLAGNKLNYNLSFNIADNKAEITRYNNPDKFLDDYYEGMTVGEIWGYKTAGFFESENDISNHADQSRFRSTSSGKYQPGDIKLQDLNGDGVIGPGSNTADNPGDRRVIGNSRPRYTFGFNFDAQWNNIFVSAFFQGVGQQDWYPSAEANFWGQYNRPYNHIPSWHLNEGMVWSEDNPDSFFPRYVSRQASAGDGIMRQNQTKYLMNAAYVRLKNFQIGYNLPNEFLSSLSIRDARIFFSGENIWSWSPLYKTADNLDIENQIARSDELARPGESIRQGYNYPILRTLTMGLSITF